MNHPAGESGPRLAAGLVASENASAALAGPSAEPLAVLVSGGLDSAILVGEALQSCSAVYPLYIRCGLFWEEVEQDHLRRFLQALSGPALKPLHVLHLPTVYLLADHWSVTGQGIPGAATPDEAVFLPGRNVLLLSKVMLWCHLHGVPAIAVGLLASNPFPDATPGFFTVLQAVVNQAVEGRVRVLQPYRNLHKAEVLHRARGLPLQWTFSCIKPIHGRHCGTA